MQTITPKNISTPQRDSLQEVQRMIDLSVDRYNRIRTGIMKCFELGNLPSIIIYQIANTLDFIAVKEYQINVINFVEKKMTMLENKDLGINFDQYMNIYNGQGEIDKCWKTILGILKEEKVKVIELCRIAPELKTSAFENFIYALDNFISGNMKGEENADLDDKGNNK